MRTVPRYSLRTLLIAVTITSVVFCYLAMARRAIGANEGAGTTTWVLVCGATTTCIFGVLLLAEGVYVLFSPRFARLQKVLAACVLALSVSILGPLNALVFVRFDRFEPFITLAFVLVQGCSFGVIMGGLLAASAISQQGRVHENCRAIFSDSDDVGIGTQAVRGAHSLSHLRSEQPD